MEIVIPSEVKKYIPALERAANNAGLPADTTAALQAVMGYILPPWSAGLREEFWETELGQLVARAQWSLNAHQAMMIAEAAREIYGSNAHKYLKAVKDNLPLYRRPDVTYKWHRKEAQGTSRKWYVLRSDVQAFKVRLGERESNKG